MKLSPGQMSCEDCRRRKCVQTADDGLDLPAAAFVATRGRDPLCGCDCHERTEAERVEEDRVERMDAAYEQSFAQLLEEDAPWL